MDCARDTSEDNSKSAKTGEATATSECDVSSGLDKNTTIKLKDSKIPEPTSSVLFDSTANCPKQSK